VTMARTPATCHPDRPVNGRGLCRGCYSNAHRDGRLHQHQLVRRPRADFVPDYQLLRSVGHTRTQIAERLGMTRAAVDQAYRRAVRASLLTPDRRPA